MFGVASFKKAFAFAWLNLFHLTHIYRLFLLNLIGVINVAKAIDVCQERRLEKCDNRRKMIIIKIILRIKKYRGIIIKENYFFTYHWSVTQSNYWWFWWVDCQYRNMYRYLEVKLRSIFHYGRCPPNQGTDFGALAESNAHSLYPLTHTGARRE